YLTLSDHRAPFDNPTLRRAVSYALDRHALLHALGVFAGRRATHYLAPGIPGYVARDPYPRGGADFRRAKELAGRTRSVATFDGCRRECEQTVLPIVQYGLAQIGIALTPSFVRGCMIATCADLSFERWTPDFADPFAVLNVLLDPASWFFNH